MKPEIATLLSQVSDQSPENEIHDVFSKISLHQRAFRWRDWGFGFDLIDDPKKIYQLSESNVLRLIVLIVCANEENSGFFRKASSKGAVKEIIRLSRKFLEDTQSSKAMIVDATYDFRADTPPNRDPDGHSETLRQYHKILWSKELPNGSLLDLSDDSTGMYLYHSSKNGTFNLTSDSISHSYHYVRRMEHIINALDLNWSRHIYDSLHTIGGYALFPGDKRQGVMTINQARGCNQRIVDRFDLTLECIRRHYRGDDHPLAKTLTAYSDFFELFVDFEGYVQFFMFQDLTSPDDSEVDFLLPFDGSFSNNPFPNDLAEYDVFIKNTMNYVCRRTERLVQYQSSLSPKDLVGNI